MNAIELPFLYQTRTVLRCSSRPKALQRAKPSQRSQRCLATTPSARTGDPSEFFLSQKAKQVTKASRRKSKPSITRTEKQVFDEIFHDIKTSSERPPSAKYVSEETDPDAILRLFVEESGQRPNLNAEAAAGSKTREHPETRWNDYINRYPSPLRNAARWATPQQPTQAGLPYRSFQPPETSAQPIPADRGSSKDPRHGVYRPLDAALEAEGEKIADLPALQLRNFDAIKDEEAARGTFRGKTADYVEKELKRISTELQSCISPKCPFGAFKMWEICQQEILPIVLQLDKQPEAPDSKGPTGEKIAAGLEPTTSVASKPTPKKPSKKSKAKKEPVAENTPPHLPAPAHLTPSIPPDLRPLSVITALYPTLTLLALRLFTTHFPTTPFALTLYETLKSSSPHARILALNVHFYNTLLAHVWAVYSSVAQISGLLSEMRTAGIDFDGSTYVLLKGIEDERWAEVRLGEGTRGKEWWERPEQVRGWEGLVGWKGVVEKALMEMGLGGQLSEREYSADLLGKGEERERARVWL